MKVKIREQFFLEGFKRNLIHLKYEVLQIDSRTLALEQDEISGYLQNGFSTFIIKNITIVFKERFLEIICELNAITVAIFVFSAILALGFQVIETGLSDNLIDLVKAIPFLIIAALTINVSAVLSTLKRDVRRSLKSQI